MGDVAGNFSSTRPLPNAGGVFCSGGAIFAGATVVTHSSVVTSDKTEDPFLAFTGNDTPSARRTNNSRMNLTGYRSVSGSITTLPARTVTRAKPKNDDGSSSPTGGPAVDVSDHIVGRTLSSRPGLHRVALHAGAVAALRRQDKLIIVQYLVGPDEGGF